MTKKILLLAIAILLLNFGVMAFAVSSQYYDGYPLYMQPGETTNTFFTLQNIAGTKNITVKAEIKDGKDILELTDASNIYKVPIGEKTKVNFKITAPSNSEIGDKFPITLTFITITEQGESPVAIGTSIGKGFEVIIGQPSDFVEVPQEKKNYLWVYIVIGVIILLIIVFFVIKKKQIPKTRFIKKK